LRKWKQTVDKAAPDGSVQGWYMGLWACQGKLFPPGVSQPHLYIPPIINKNKINIGIKKGYREKK